MGFSTHTEQQTLQALTAALEPRFRVYEKVRVIDCLKATAARPRVSDPVGPTLGTWLLPAMRALAGPFGRNHSWLQAGDWTYALQSHFDFVVHADMDSPNPSHPLFAVEFDGDSHRRPEVQRRDRRKNRLCAAAGLPLVRIDGGLLARRERVVVVQWLAETWAAYRDEMPRLMAERDAEINAMSDDEFAAHGDFLLLERPDLDVELTFRLEHRFPPVTTAVRRLADRYGFRWPYLDPTPPETGRWSVRSWADPYSNLSEPVETWRCELTIAGPSGERTVSGVANVCTAYELYDEPPPGDRWSLLYAGKLPYLPAGPWHTAPSVLGESLCLHNALLEAERFIRRSSRKR